MDPDPDAAPGPASTPVPEPAAAVTPEDLEDALLEGDREVRRGTAMAALAFPMFRRVWGGSLLSNVGSWMQNVVLGAYVYDLTGSAMWVSAVTFAQLGPLLLLSIVGGTLADLFDRRRLLILVALEQAAFSVVLAGIVALDDPPIGAIIVVVGLIGIGQAVHAPTFTAVTPMLVDREVLPGAVSLQSASMNASRVVGPAIGGVLFASVGASWVFLLNAATYAFIIGALWPITLPPAPPPSGDRGLARLLGGFRAASADPVISRCLLTMTSFSLLCLPFVAQMPTLAEQNFGVDPDSAVYGALYATFGAGALLGALSIGTVFAGGSLARIVRLGLVGFALTLGAFALTRDPAPAFPVAVLLGFTYFATVTSLSSVVQQRVDETQRGRVMALWIMSFGGTVPIGALIAGPVIEATSMTAVMLFGAVVAAGLAWWCDLRAAAGGSDPSLPAV